MGMWEAMEKLNGGCYCGAVRYQIASAPAWSAHCHCRSCQMALGGAFVTWAKIAAEDFVVTKGEIKTIQKIPGATRGFCGACGTTLTYAAETEVEGQDWSAAAWSRLQRSMIRRLPNPKPMSLFPTSSLGSNSPTIYRHFRNFET